MKLFTRVTPGGRVIDCTDQLRHSCAGASCWIMGAGPSIHQVPHTLVSQSGASVFAVNYAGFGEDGKGWLIKPTHWTCFDSTNRFSENVFRDPSIIKFIRAGREKDQLYRTTVKVDHCPNVYFIHDKHKSYDDFFDPFSDSINNSLDSFVQCLDIAIKLGYRHLYCIGAEMRVTFSPEQRQWIRDHGVDIDEDGYSEYQTNYTDRMSFILDVVAANSRMAVHSVKDALAALARSPQYSFDEQKSFSAAVSSDGHYWDRVQYLRQARRCMALHGINLISCTPNSRLNEFFPYRSVEEAHAEIVSRVGDVKSESTKGKYTQKGPSNRVFTRDLKPYGAVRAANKGKGPGAERAKPEEPAISPNPELAAKVNKLMQATPQIEEQF